MARTDVTPSFPVRLSGYGNRTAEATEIAQPLFAKALAIRSGDAPPVVLVTVDTLGVSAAMTDAVAARLREKHGVPRAGVALCASHTHSAGATERGRAHLFAEARAGRAFVPHAEIRRRADAKAWRRRAGGL
ncbi:MAG: neutral/alkaline non-lysosomal ceramidase N-terminal domain-containing protein [Pirellulales bacterium]